MEEIKTRRILRRFFITKLNRVKKSVRYEIEDFIFSHDKEIDHFEYGRIPNFRTYIIVLKSGEKIVWNLSK